MFFIGEDDMIDAVDEEEDVISDGGYPSYHPSDEE